MRYINPVINMDYPDPDVIRVGETYYMISTTMHFMPGGVILSSTNLVDWKIESYVFDSLENNDSERMEYELVDYAGGMWAPCLRYHNGTFYVLFGKHSGKCETYLYTAKDITGPWNKQVFAEYYHDCSLLFDDDRAYIVCGNRNIHLFEVDLNKIKEIDGTHKIIVNDSPETPLGYEGSHIYKINGYYYVFFINWPKRGIRTQWCYRAKSLNDKFEGRIVFSDNGGVRGCGIAQGGIFDTPDGQWYTMLFQDNGAVGRMPVLLPMTWQDDWPVIENIDVAEQIRSKLELEDVNSNLYCSDDFKYKKEEGSSYKLHPAWQWNHVPDNSAWTIGDQGGLVITTNKIAINMPHAKNCLTQRMMYPECGCEVTVDATNLNDGDVAGLCALQSNYGLVGVMKQYGEYYIVKMVQDPSFAVGSSNSGDCFPGQILEKVHMDGSSVRLCIESDFVNMNDEVSFFYEKKGSMIMLGDSHHMEYRLDHFTGYRFGLFIFSTKTIGGSVVFRDFVYKK